MQIYVIQHHRSVYIASQVAYWTVEKVLEYLLSAKGYLLAALEQPKYWPVLPEAKWLSD